MEDMNKIIAEFNKKTKNGSIDKLYEIGLIDEEIVSIYTDNKNSEWVFKLDFLVEYIAGKYGDTMLRQHVKLFREIKEFERIYNKDASDFTKEEVIGFLESYRSASYNSLINRYSLLNNYINIAKENNIGNSTLPTGLLLKPEDMKSATIGFKPSI